MRILTGLALTLVLVGCSQSESLQVDDPLDPPDVEQTDEQASADATMASANRIVLAFDTYLSKHQIDSASIAVSYDNQLIAHSGLNRQATDLAPVASLSKAITAICTIKALDEFGFDVSATLSEVVPQLMSTSQISDVRMLQISIAQLITHNSGLHTPHLSVLGSTVTSMQSEQKQWQFNFIAADGLAANPGSGYYYANSNYLILGLVIEELTGVSYESWCHSHVLEPLSISSAQISPQWAILSSYGGWEISAADYVRFIDANFTEKLIAGEDPATLNIVADIGGGAVYSLGTLMRSTSNGFVYWHAGSFTWQSSIQSGKFGSFFAAYANGFTVSVNMNIDLNNGRGLELDQVLYQAAH